MADRQLRDRLLAGGLPGCRHDRKEACRSYDQELIDQEFVDLDRFRSKNGLRSLAGRWIGLRWKTEGSCAPSFFRRSLEADIMNGKPLWDRWEEIDRLLEMALDQPSDTREAFLTETCGGDQELLNTLRELARISSETETRRPGPGPELLRAALAGLPEKPVDPPERLLGTKVGPYRLSRILGVGGMGAVYLGERIDGAFERRVAVKVLRAELDTRGVMDRFRLERQILATLSHGAIAQMIDGGITEDGRPAFVMEYVEGVPIDRHADDLCLGVEERIGLIVRVAEAVEYAHRHMVVHRDIKPSNILVTPEGEVKLLDFGTAKLLEEPEPGESGLTTRHRARFVTPEYAAPEQLLGEAVSTQTDVYALGGLLYELLTGVRPYSRRGSQSVLERMIRGDEPTAPSVAAMTASVSSGESREGSPVGGGGIAGRLGSTPEGLRRRLSGDLDAILLRALQTRPEARYVSVSSLREDLERHLSGHPVMARGASLPYRTRRFVRRHRGLVTLGAALFLIVAGSAVGLAFQRAAVLEQWNRAEAAAEAATQKAEEARQVTDFLVALFQASDPLQSRGDSITVRSLLERGAGRMDRDLADQPAVRAELLETLGQVYENLGAFEDAVSLLQRAAMLRRDSLPGKPGLARSLVRLADAHRLGREFEASLSVYRRAVEEASATGDAGTLAEARIGLGSAFVLLDQVDSAEAELRQGIAAVSNPEGEGELMQMNALVNLAGVLRRRGDMDGAADIFLQVIQRQRRTPRMDALAFATTLNNLASLRRLQGDAEKARELYQEAYDSLSLTLGPGHPEALLISGNLAGVLSRMGRVEEALDVYRERVAAAREQWPEGHWQTARALMNLGAELVTVGRAREAVDPLVEAVDLAAAQIGAQHSWTNVYRGWLGSAAALEGKKGEAERLFDWSLEGLAQYPELSKDGTVKAMLRSLVEVMEAQGLTEEAERYRGLVDLSGSSGG